MAKNRKETKSDDAPPVAEPASVVAVPGLALTTADPLPPGLVELPEVKKTFDGPREMDFTPKANEGPTSIRLATFYVQDVLDHGDQRPKSARMVLVEDPRIDAGLRLVEGKRAGLLEIDIGPDGERFIKPNRFVRIAFSSETDPNPNQD